MDQRCIDEQSPPDMQPGDTVSHGRFFRNLKKGHVAKRYQNDDDDNPEFGYKLTKSHWRYADHQRGPLSVNLCSCIHSEICSIVLQPGGEDYYHVASIDLEALNRNDTLAYTFLAQYSPAEEFNNRCHFEIIPEDGTVLAWMMFGEFLDRPFPPAKKLPATDQDRSKAAEACAEYRSCFDIRRWIRCKDGALG